MGEEPKTYGKLTQAMTNPSYQGGNQWVYDRVGTLIHPRQMIMAPISQMMDILPKQMEKWDKKNEKETPIPIFTSNKKELKGIHLDAYSLHNLLGGCDWILKRATDKNWENDVMVYHRENHPRGYKSHPKECGKDLKDSNITLPVPDHAYPEKQIVYIQDIQDA